MGQFPSISSAHQQHLFDCHVGEGFGEKKKCSSNTKSLDLFHFQI